MNKSIKEDKRTGTVTLKVSISKRRTADEPVISFLTRDAKLLLLKEGWDISACRKKDSLSNLRESDKHTGEWVFDLSNSKKEPSVEKSSEKIKKPSLTETKKSDTIQKKKEKPILSNKKGK